MLVAGPTSKSAAMCLVRRAYVKHNFYHIHIVCVHSAFPQRLWFDSSRALRTIFFICPKTLALNEQTDVSLRFVGRFQKGQTQLHDDASCLSR